jgi:hypothetical protein
MLENAFKRLQNKRQAEKDGDECTSVRIRGGDSAIIALSTRYPTTQYNDTKGRRQDCRSHDVRRREHLWSVFIIIPIIHHRGGKEKQCV